MNKTTDSYKRYSSEDNCYAGAAEVINEELKHLHQRRGTRAENIRGLALSGGGIRSASFCLGVIQALAKADRLDDIDYLSTVSGGGYIGGALSWAWLDHWRKETSCTTEFGTGPDNFPYGTTARYKQPNPDMDRHQASMMRHLRQNGKYLVPGKGITILSFISIILRSVLMGLVTLLVLLSLAFHLLHLTPIFDKGLFGMSYMLNLGAGTGLLYLLSLLYYGDRSSLYSKDPDTAYKSRRTWEISIKYLLITSLGFLFVGLIDLARQLIDQQVEIAGGTSATLGAILAWYFNRKSGPDLRSYLPKTVMVYIGVFVMFSGLFLLSDKLAVMLINSSFNAALLGHSLLAVIILVSAYTLPINRISIHRYYRDRLMETFMPDICRLFDIDGHQTSIAERSNRTALHDCMPGETSRMPFHIINTNIILVESKRAKFRGRGGDNFILSPLYSGSNATGWHRTRDFANGSITLPTAVAISGAAANPDAGVAGQGLTVNPFISAIMSIFNLRLGYWAVNPDTRIQPDQSVIPNYIEPGFRGILSRRRLNEDYNFIQLSDGGHFENLALYELIRRRCKLIICCDAEEDHDYVFGSLSNIIEKARVDFGATIAIDENQLQQLKTSVDEHGEIQFAKKGYLCADIFYPDTGCGESSEPGTLIYIKSTLPADLPADIIGYRKTHSAFPHESTADQFFDEKQLEAYRCLGMFIAETLLDDNTINWSMS